MGTQWKSHLEAEDRGWRAGAAVKKLNMGAGMAGGWGESERGGLQANRTESVKGRGDPPCPVTAS